MHPDEHALIIKLIRAFVLIVIAIYSFKCGRIFYEMVNQLN